jgi:GT2 family glycosyltransferase
MASALCLRRRALDQVGLLDEQFPIFWNDVDLCYRLRAARWSVYFCPDAEVAHHLGASTHQARPRVIADSHRGLIRFYRKHYRRRIAWPVYAVAVAAIWLARWPRWLAARLREGLRRRRERV